MALLLRKQGISRIRPLAGGFQAWRELGFPVEPLTSQPSGRACTVTHIPFKQRFRSDLCYCLNVFPVLIVVVGGPQSAAARLGMKRTHLDYPVKRRGIDQPSSRRYLVI